MSTSTELTRFPDVSGAPNLERLILSDYDRLVEVHESVGLQKKLVHLDLRGCRHLRYPLPRMEMESLETLILSECSSLERFLEISPCMRKLSKIYLDHCDQIKELPSSVKFLSALSFLNLIGCGNLKNLPNSICELKNLKSLYLDDCTRLRKLPENVGRMEPLEKLQLGLGLSEFQEEDFPKNLYALSSLEELLLCGNSKLIQLPVSIYHLPRLKFLELSKCRRLERLNELPSGIQVLNKMLQQSFLQRGIYTFKDNEKLQVGKSISVELLKAIEESRFAVVVFSKNYANSSWCLDELAKIMKCHEMGQRVLPVFYHVDPSDVCKQKRSFNMAFQKHEENLKEETEKVQKWREALASAASLSGWDITETANVRQSECINKTVQQVLGDIKPHSMDNIVGIESCVQKLSSLLDTGSTEEVCMIGICGMGGIGKTTIAKALFQRIAYKFEGSSFVKDVRVNSSNDKDICALQQKILRDILMTSELPIWDPDYGVAMIRSRLCNKKVLLVLDDVDHVKQLDFLAASHDWFSPGSRIVITTRDEHLLSDAHEKYELDVLLMDQAVELFSRYAFRKNSPPEGYEELSHRVVCYSGHLPLALKVLGSFFRRRQASVWQSALNRLANEPNTEIFDKLKLSFDGLEASEKNIFLDIACFFKGRDKEHVTRILDSFGFDPVIGITVLMEKSLLTVSRGRLDMHDLIQEMGWKIVLECFSNSRLWQRKQIHDLVMRNSKLKAIEAIMLQNKDYYFDHDDEKLDFNAEIFTGMKNLRLLHIDSNFISDEPYFLPNKLRWLCCYDYPFSSLQLAHMHMLVGLELHNSAIKHLWDGLKIPSLKFINMSTSKKLTRFPDVSGAPNLEKLILSGCHSLVEVDKSVGLLKKLVYLDLRDCRRLRYLLPRMEMESLETLILSGCNSLERFPDISPCMGKLSKIYLDYCVQMEELPSSIKFLSALSFLNLRSCTNLKNLRNSICELKHLKSLHLQDCTRLQKLSEDLGSMVQLEELQLGLPDDLGSIVQLEELHLGLLEKVRSMVRSMVQSVVRSMYEPSLRIDELTYLCSLRKLDLSWRQFQEEDFPKNLCGLSSLEELHLCGNSKLIQLPASISHLPRLKFLELSECFQLERLNELPSGIQVLKAKGCSSLKKIGDLSQQCGLLFKLWIFDCHKLLEDQKNGRYLNEMLQQSFLQKCAAVNHRLSIAIPGSKIQAGSANSNQEALFH